MDNDPDNEEEVNRKRSHLECKKFVFGLIGTLSVLIVFILSIYCIVKSPETAGHIVGLADTTIAFLASVTGIMLTGQSFVDWKHGGSV